MFSWGRLYGTVSKPRALLSVLFDGLGGLIDERIASVTIAGHVGTPELELAHFLGIEHLLHGRTLGADGLRRDEDDQVVHDIVRLVDVYKRQA